MDACRHLGLPLKSVLPDEPLPNRLNHTTFFTKIAQNKGDINEVNGIFLPSISCFIMMK